MAILCWLIIILTSAIFGSQTVLLGMTASFPKITILLPFHCLGYSGTPWRLNDHLRNFKLSTPYNVDKVWFAAFLSHNLPLFERFSLYGQVDVVENIARQRRQKRYLLQKVFLLLQPSPINIVEHFLVAFFVHDGEHAICCAQNACSSCLLPIFVFIFHGVFLDGQFSETFPRTQPQHRLHQLMTTNKIVHF